MENLYSEINEEVVSANVEELEINTSVEYPQVNATIQLPQTFNCKMQSNNINCQVGNNVINTAIEPLNTKSSVIDGDLYYKNIFVPYNGAIKDVDLNNKNIDNSNILKGKELIALNGITLNGVRINKWQVGEGAYWGDILGDINNQTDLINLINSITPGSASTKIDNFIIDDNSLNTRTITLTKEVKNPNSIRVFIENIGLMAEVGVDYSIADNIIYWTGYEFTSKLELGDKLKVLYD